LRPISGANFLTATKDWKEVDQHRRFEQTSQFTELQNSWGDITIEQVQTRSYVFPSFENDRRNAFSKSAFPPIMSTILTFHFPSDFDHLFKNPEWDTAWHRFSNAALRSEGGVVSSGTCAGWSIDHKSFCGVVKYQDIPTMKQYLAEAELKVSSEGGLGKLKELARWGVDVEFASMFCLEDGWLGSVTETQKDRPELQYLLDFARNGILPDQRLERSTGSHSPGPRPQSPSD
jgi:hypothetical protein